MHFSGVFVPPKGRSRDEGQPNQARDRLTDCCLPQPIELAAVHSAGALESTGILRQIGTKLRDRAVLSLLSGIISLDPLQLWIR